MDIGQRIRQLRVSNDLTQEELASRCELQKDFYHNWKTIWLLHHC